MLYKFTDSCSVTIHRFLIYTKSLTPILYTIINLYAIPIHWFLFCYHLPTPPLYQITYTYSPIPNQTKLCTNQCLLYLQAWRRLVNVTNMVKIVRWFHKNVSSNNLKFTSRLLEELTCTPFITLWFTNSFFHMRSFTYLNNVYDVVYDRLRPVDVRGALLSLNSSFLFKRVLHYMCYRSLESIFQVGGPMESPRNVISFWRAA